MKNRKLLLFVFSLIFIGCISMSYVNAESNYPPNMPTISPNGGTYNGSQRITISCSDRDVNIRYTTDGSEPTTSSKYVSNGGTVAISSSCILKAKAFRNGYGSNTAYAYYTIILPPKAPILSLKSGKYYNTHNVTISCKDTDVDIRYTLDGSEPTVTSNYISNGGTVYIGSTCTLKAKAFRNNMASGITSAYYSINLIPYAPIIRPGGGTYSSPQNVTILSGENNVELRYTLDGSEPTTSSNYVSRDGSIYISNSCTLQVKAFRNGYGSRTASASYKLATPPNAPILSLNGGTYSGTQKVIITCNDSDVSIRYTTDGSEPTLKSKNLSNGEAVYINSTCILRAKAFRHNMGSVITDAYYSINTALNMPTISPSGGTFNSAQNVTISCSDSNVELRYTLDGSEPTQYSSYISNGGTVSISNSCTLQVKAFGNGNGSSIASAYFTINTMVNTTVNQPIITPAPGTYTSAQWVSLSGEPETAIRFTTDGSEPTTSSSLYAYSIRVDKTTTIKAKAYKGTSSSDTLTAVYVIGSAPAALTDEDVDSKLAEARRLFSIGKCDDSIEICDELLADDPDMQDAIILKANNYVNKNNLIEAKRILKEFIKVYEFPRVINRFAEVCITRGEATEGKRAVLNILEKYANETYLYKTITYANNKMGIDQIVVYLYGKEVDFDNYDSIYPRIQDGRVLIPIRALTEAMGAYVDWNASQMKATVTLEDNTVVLVAGNNTAKVNGKSVKLDVPAQIEGPRMLVPLRFVAENLGKTVDWNQVEDAKTISVTNYSIIDGSSSTSVGVVY